MTLVELNAVATPVGGIIGGITAVRGQGSVVLITAGGLGLLVGVVLYFSTLGVGWVAARIAARFRQGGSKPDREAAALAGTALVPMMIVPAVSTILAHWIADTLFH